MKAKDKRLAELYKWASQKPERQNIPTITNHAIQRYKVKEPTARNYAIQIMIKLGKLSQPMKVSDLWKEYQKEKENRSSPLHYPKFMKASELDKE